MSDWAPYYLYYSDRDNDAVVIQADSNDLFDYHDDHFLSRKAYETEEEAQLALDHLKLLVNSDKLLQLARWMKGQSV